MHIESICKICEHEYGDHCITFSGEPGCTGGHHAYDSCSCAGFILRMWQEPSVADEYDWMQYGYFTRQYFHPTIWSPSAITSVAFTQDLTARVSQEWAANIQNMGDIVHIPSL